MMCALFLIFALGPWLLIFQFARPPLYLQEWERIYGLGHVEDAAAGLAGMTQPLHPKVRQLVAQVWESTGI